MKQLLSIVIGSIMLLSMSGCFGSGYKDRDDFKKLETEERKEIYKLILKDQKIILINDVQLTFLDHIITESKSFITLQKQFPVNNFSDFLNVGIPVLYYSYSPNNYESAPEEWKDKATKFIVDFPPYDLNYGENKYRAWREKMIKDENPLIAFPYYDKSQAFGLITASGFYANDSLFDLMVLVSWTQDFTFADFKLLNTDSQAKLLRVAAQQISSKVNSPGTELNLFLDSVQKKWKEDASSILGRQEILSIKDNTSVKDVVYELLSILVK